MQLNNIINFIVQMKDIISITISTLALFVSVYTSMHSKHEEKRTILGQLTDVLDSMTSLTIEAAKLQFEYASKDPDYFQKAISPQLEQKYASLLDQAMYLAKQELVKPLITAIEYNTLALANMQIGQLALAEEYYRKAITVCKKKDNYYKALAMYSYAIFLFRFFGAERVNEARAQFTASINLLNNTHPIVAHSQNSHTYMVWAWFERNMIEGTISGAPKQSIALFEYAAKEVEKIDFPDVRERAKMQFQLARDKNVSPLMPNIQGAQLSPQMSAAAMAQPQSNQLSAYDIANSQRVSPAQSMHIPSFLQKTVKLTTNATPAKLRLPNKEGFDERHPSVKIAPRLLV